MFMIYLCSQTIIPIISFFFFAEVIVYLEEASLCKLTLILT